MFAQRASIVCFSLILISPTAGFAQRLGSGYVADHLFFFVPPGTAAAQAGAAAFSYVPGMAPTPTINATTADGGDWLAFTPRLAAPAAGTMGTAVSTSPSRTVIYDAHVKVENLAPGIYTGEIHIVQDGLRGSPATVPVTLFHDRDLVTLHRGDCFSGCPIYNLRIGDSGGVTFQQGGPEQPHQFAVISAAEVGEIQAQVEKAHVFSRQDAFSAHYEDGPEMYLEVTLNGTTKRITGFDYGPPELRQLARTIERIANIHRWMHAAGPNPLSTRLTGFGMFGGEDLTNAEHVTTDLRQRIKPGMTALMQAAGLGHVMDLRTALAAGDDVNAADETGWTALMLAAAGAQPQSVAALLDAGARVDQRDRYGNTALIGAASAWLYTGHKKAAEAAQFLIARGASVDAVNDRGESALMWAAKYGNGAMLQVLLQAGASPTRSDRSGHDAAYYLASARRDLSYDPAAGIRYEQAETALRAPIKQ